MSATHPPSPAATAPARADAVWRGAAAPRRAGAVFLAFWAALAAAYGLWLLAFWPGILGEDSVAILLEVEGDSAFRSGKTVFWYYAIRLLYGGTRLVEVPVLALMLLCALILARMLAWSWSAGLRKTSLFGLVFVALAPHMVAFTGMLYPDAIFAVASCGLVFELWLAVRRRGMDAASLAMVAVVLPFAAFCRPNGLVFLLPVVAVLPFVHGRARRVLAAILLAWCALMAAAHRAHPSQAQEAVYPMAVFETVNFLRPHAMHDLWTQFAHMNDPWVLAEPRVSPATLELLRRHRPIASMNAYSDPAYWDMLVFHPEGPQLGGLPVDDRRTLVREFFRYNLWHNLPVFAGSRTTVFLTAALAEGGFPAVTYATQVLPRIHSGSAYRRFDLEEVERGFIALQKASYHLRWLLWTPWAGFALLAWALVRGVRRRDAALLVVALPMAIQCGAIFLLSTAGEYRYLLPFFVLPLALLPAWVWRREAPAAAASAPQPVR
ncbi:hypothetical protein M4R22_02155 [Acidovorax sp. GBBC 3334]|uniref:hypothetical protein n=1 Tax=Acidovorax sp. GBBC 3334 TaxID=2940496 RepID=UPI00230377AD|nr:hypothetical protein [Acidovorax sp. GBBC 3334]MDA8453556.1 hypothetical protein [Acidovorax sp. GBBC 3334]